MPIVRTIYCCFIALAQLSLASTAAAIAQPFTFRDAEFMAADRGMSEAEDFVATQLPQGLSLLVAIHRLQRAGMNCEAARTTDASTFCDFSELVHNEGVSLEKIISLCVLIQVGWSWCLRVWICSTLARGIRTFKASRLSSQPSPKGVRVRGY